jgi:putative hydrolase of the HAD superfamily
MRVNGTGETGSGDALARLQGADTWLFDLDDTLYSAETDFFRFIDQRIGAFISDLLGLDPVAARKVQKDYFSRFGTTLRGLMDLHDVQPDDYLGFVHDVDVSALERDQALVDALAGLDGRKYVFTNSPLGYAQRVLEHLGIAEFMDGIFDVAASGYVPKPRQPAYDALVAAFDLDPPKTVYVEDMSRNLTPAAEMGMVTVWLCNDEKWGALDHSPEHVDFEINDLPSWLSGLGSQGKGAE